MRFGEQKPLLPFACHLHLHRFSPVQCGLPSCLEHRCDGASRGIRHVWVRILEASLPLRVRKDCDAAGQPGAGNTEDVDAARAPPAGGSSAPSGESRESSAEQPRKNGSRHWSPREGTRRPGECSGGLVLLPRLLTSHWPTPWAMLSFYPLRDRLHRTDQYWAKRCPQIY